MNLFIRQQKAKGIQMRTISKVMKAGSFVLVTCYADFCILISGIFWRDSLPWVDSYCEKMARLSGGRLKYCEGGNPFVLHHEMFVPCLYIGLFLCLHVSVIQMYESGFGNIETRIDFPSCPQAANRAEQFSETCTAWSLSLFLIPVVSDLYICLSVWLK